MPNNPSATATNTSTTAAASVFVPDSSSPLYIHSSYIPGVSLVPVPFSGVGFGGWRRSVIVSLSARNKMAFMDGSYTRPEDGSPQVKQWDRCNNLVISWLTSSLSPDIADSVQYSETAQSIWEQLNNRYGTINGTKIFELKKEIVSTVQGQLNIAAYFNKLKKLWDELGIMCVDHAKKCTCAAKSGLQKDFEENKLYQFLMGLNETYISVRSNLLMMNPLPSLDISYNILLQDEGQRHVTPSFQFSTESASFNATFNNNHNRGYSSNSTTSSSNNTRFPSSGSSNYNRSSSSTSSNHTSFQRQYNQRVNFGNNKLEPFCRYCKNNGHLISQCPKLKRKAAANAEVEVFSSLSDSTCNNNASTSINSSSPIPGMSREQYSQLMNLIQHIQFTDHSSQVSPTLLTSANFAGKIEISPGLHVKSSACMLANVPEYN